MFFVLKYVILLAFIVLNLVCSVQSQEIGSEERLWNGLFVSSPVTDQCDQLIGVHYRTLA